MLTWIKYFKENNEVPIKTYDRVHFHTHLVININFCFSISYSSINHKL